MTPYAHVIIEVNDGLLEDPRLFTTEDLAGHVYESCVIENGKFRPKNDNETWSDYVMAFHEYTYSEHCKYDPMEYEIHWFNRAPIENQLYED